MFYIFKDDRNTCPLCYTNHAKYNGRLAPKCLYISFKSVSVESVYVTAPSERPANPPLKLHVILSCGHFALLPQTLSRDCPRENSRRIESSDFLRSNLQNAPLIWYDFYTFTDIHKLQLPHARLP
jgi:hypothetical protein